MKLLAHCWKTVACLSICLISQNAYSDFQILPDAGGQAGFSYYEIGELEAGKANGILQTGHIKPVACGEYHLSRTSCYRFTPLKSKNKTFCLQTNRYYLRNENMTSEKGWVANGQFGKLIDLVEPFETDEWHTPTNGNKTFEKGWRTGTIASQIECPALQSVRPFILQTLTFSHALDLPFSYNLKDSAHEFCLLAERFTHSSPVRYAYNRTQFYCLEADTLSDAESIADSFKSKFSEMGSKIYGGYVNDPRNAKVSLRSSQLTSTNLNMVDIQISTVSPEKIEMFYDTTGLAPEIMPGKAAVVFAIDEMFNK